MLHIFGNLSVSVIAPAFFLVCTFAGTLIMAALLWFEVDEYNPVVKQIYQTSAKVNCAAVFQSLASKIAGLSWSSWGFTYFMGTVIFLIPLCVIRNDGRFSIPSILNQVSNIKHPASSIQHPASMNDAP